MARNLNETLAKLHDEDELKAELENYDENEDGEVTGEDLIRTMVKSRKLLPNASYFAFTATPKNKTLELFGEPFRLIYTQTLSRLNRSHPLKKETFILDFANDAEDIQEAFKPYFETTILGEEILKHVTSNFDLYKLYSDNNEFREDFSAMMFGVVKELISKELENNR
jgi:type I site-specific restriction-modification system R (restriction) subunit